MESSKGFFHCSGEYSIIWGVFQTFFQTPYITKSKIEIMAPVNHWFPLRPAIKPLLLMWVRWGCLISHQLGGGFNLCFIFTSYLGKMNPFWRTYSSNSLKPPTSQSMEHFGAKLSEPLEVSSLASWVGPGRWNDAVVSDVAWFGSFKDVP